MTIWKTIPVSLLKRLSAAEGRSDFTIPNWRTAAGFKKLDAYIAAHFRVKTWQVDLVGSVSASGDDGLSFSATLAESTDVAIGWVGPVIYGDERAFARGNLTELPTSETWPIRQSRSQAATCGSGTVSTSLEGSFSLSSAAGTVLTGPKLGVMTTGLSMGLEEARAQVDLTWDCQQTGGTGIFTTWRLTTDPTPLTLEGGGFSSPTAVGSVKVRIPDWRNGGMNEVTLCTLYVDRAVTDWFFGPDYSYVSDAWSGTVDATLSIPSGAGHVWKWPVGGVDTWADDGSLLVGAHVGL